MSAAEPCELCLSTERTVTAMEDTHPAYQTFIKCEVQESGAQRCGTINCTRFVRLCWECRAILHKFHRFKMQAFLAKEILEEMQAQDNVAELRPCLSNLGHSIKTSYDRHIWHDSDSCKDDVETLTHEFEVKSEIDFDDRTDFEAFTEAGPTDVEDSNTNDTQIKIEEGNADIDVTTKVELELEPVKVKSKCDKRLKKRKKVKQDDKELYKKHTKLQTGKEELVSTNDKKSMIKTEKVVLISTWKAQRRLKTAKEELVSTVNKKTRLKMEKQDYMSEDQRSEGLLAADDEKFISTDSKNKFTKRNEANSTRKEKSTIEISLTSKEKRDTCKKVGIMTMCEHINATAEQICKAQKSCDKPAFGSNCAICNQTFATEEESRRHRESHLNDANPRPALCCRLCGHIALDAEDMWQHYSSQHPHIPVRRVRNRKIGGSKPDTARPGFNCDICGLHIKTYSYFKAHHRTHTQPRTYQCDQCSVTYTRRNQILRHLRCHELRFLCEICGKRFAEFPPLNIHYMSHLTIDARPHACTLCPRKFITKDKLADHMVFHKGIKPFACDQCDSRFRLKPDMNRHKKLKHSTGQFVEKPKATRTKSLFRNERLIVDEKTGKVRPPKKQKETKRSRGVRLESYPCKLCGKNFTQKNSLDAHAVFHTGVRPHKCDECDLTFKYQSGLWSHKLLHKGVKPHQCTVCGVQFTLKGNLKGHMKIHSNDKPYECDICGQRFSWRRNLRNHFKVHAKQ